MQTAKSPENHEGQNRNVHSRNDKNVISTGALKICAGVAIDESFLTDHHGVNQSSLLRRPKRMHFGDDTGMNAAPPECNEASRETGEQLSVIGFCRRERRDGVRGGEITFIVECAGIAEIARQLEFYRNINSLAIAKDSHGYALK